MSNILQNKKHVSFININKEKNKIITNSNSTLATDTTNNMINKLSQKIPKHDNDENKNTLNLKHNKIRSRLNSSLKKQKEVLIKKQSITTSIISSTSTTNTVSNPIAKEINFKQDIKQIEITEEDSNISVKNAKINKKLNNDFTPEDYKRMENLIIRENHDKDILNTLLSKELPTIHCLDKHKINERMRMRMVDWMIEVVNNYKCDENVFFLSVDLMDRYFYLVDKSLDPSDLHLLGVACMFSCSKYQDIYPLRLKMIYDKIAHKKLTMDEIKQKELEILSLIDYDIGKPTCWDFILFFIEEIFFMNDNKFHITSERLREKVNTLNIIKNKTSGLLSSVHSNNKAIFKSYSTNMINLLKHVALYLAKMNLHDYTLIVNREPSLISASTVFVALKICEQINKVEYLTDCFIKKLVILSNKKESDIIKVAQKILHNAQNFDSMFNGLDNLKRIHFNSIIELKNTK